jgi:hypothetical protein
MKPFIALTCALFMANSVLADPYSAAIRQAKNVSAKETAANRQLLDNPTPAPPPAAPPQNNPNQPPDPALQATLQNIESLRNDFAAIGNATAGTSLSVQKQSLTNDLAIAAQGAKPLPASISKLADDLITAIAGKEKFRTPQPKLAQYIHAIFNSAHLTAAQQQMIFSGVQKILTDGGASPEEATNVVNDIKTIASGTK